MAILLQHHCPGEGSDSPESSPRSQGIVEVLPSSHFRSHTQKMAATWGSLVPVCLTDSTVVLKQQAAEVGED